MRSNPYWNRHGATLLEFSLVGIPMIFIVLGGIEMSLGMWQYETLAYSVKIGAQSIVSKGSGCTTGVNTCGITVGTIATTVSQNAIGISADALNMTLTTASGAVTTCNPVSSCTSNTTAWPPSTNGDNMAGKPFTVTANFLLNAPFAMYYPGARSVSFSNATLESSATQVLMF